MVEASFVNIYHMGWGREGGGGGGRKIEDRMVFKGKRPGNGPCHGFPKRLLQKKKDSTLTLFQIIVLVAIRGQESVSLVTIMQTVGRLIKKIAFGTVGSQHPYYYS